MSDTTPHANWSGPKDIKDNPYMMEGSWSGTMSHEEIERRIVMDIDGASKAELFKTDGRTLEGDEDNGTYLVWF